MKNTVAVYIDPARSHQIEWCSAMAEGIRRHGFDVQEVATGEQLPENCAVVTWGWTNARPLVEQGRRVLVLERGYLGNRLGGWTSAGWNGLNGRASFPEIDDQADRFKRFFPHALQPWDHNSIGYALIIGQVPGDQSVRGLDLHRWREDAVASYHARGIISRYRHHPMERVQENSLAHDMDGAITVCTWNSNAGVDAILAGKPVVAMDIGSMAWDVATHAINDPVIRPDRETWAGRLAWCQWNTEEMRGGTAWAALTDKANFLKDAA